MSALSASPTDIKTTLNYSRDDGKRAHYVAYQPSEEEIKSGQVPSQMMAGSSASVDTTVLDARGKNLSLDTHSFELVQQTTSLSTEDFYETSQSKITDVYYKEMAEMFKKATGAAYVHVFHHQVRNQQKDNADGNGFNTTVQPYAHGVHSDSSAHSAEELFLGTAKSGAVDMKYCKGRFLYINAWRNISDAPIANNALAVLDETSLVKPDDFIGADLYMPGGSTIMQFRLNDRNAKQHRWYYYSKMRKDEVLLFKQWDSDRSLSGRLTFHTAFTDPNAPNDAPVRESIECRAIAFFPDHQPNTCPEIPKDVADLMGNGEIEGGEVVAAAVKKVLGLIDTMHAWPSFAKTWVISTTQKSGGAEDVAKAIVDDDGNYQGFKKYPKDTKKQIVQQLMKNTAWEKRLLQKVQQLKSAKGSSGSSSYYLKTLGTLAVGIIIGYFLARAKL